jgi:pimeloyl-ACP methyl ester carboxylesterase
MNRRTVLRSAAVAASTAMLGDAELARSQARGTGAPSRRHPSFVETDDGTMLFCRDWGSGPPIVFVHGWALSSDFWQYQMLDLSSRGFRCIATDRRGHGRSSDPGQGYDYDTLAGDLATILERLDLRRVTMVGHSMGGAEVVRYLSRDDGRVARVVLLGATLPFLLKTPDNPEGAGRGDFDTWRTALATDFPKWLGDNEAPFWTPATSAEMKVWGRSLPLACSLKAAVDSTYAMTETDFRPELRAVRIPTLVVHGSADRSMPIHLGRLTSQLIPGCRFQEYEGAPHGLPLTHRERLSTDLEAFARA